MRRPIGIDAAPDGAVYFADAHDNDIRRVRADGIIERVARTAGSGFGADGWPPIELEKMLNEYYRLRGWEERGRPRPETLERLGIPH